LKNRFSPSEVIEIANVALSDSTGSLEFYEEPDAGTMSSLARGFSGSGAIRRTVDVSTLDVEVEGRGVKFVDFLKVDVEGFDLNVLRGAKGLLAQQRIGLIQFEYTDAWAIAGNTLRAAYDLLNAHGYEVFILKRDGLYRLEYRKYGEYFTYSNFVAVSPTRLNYIQSLIRGVL
jgi:FkbM family methyltransferase